MNIAVNSACILSPSCSIQPDSFRPSLNELAASFEILNCEHFCFSYSALLIRTMPAKDNSKRVNEQQDDVKDQTNHGKESQGNTSKVKEKDEDIKQDNADEFTEQEDIDENTETTGSEQEDVSADSKEAGDKRKRSKVSPVSAKKQKTSGNGKTNSTHGSKHDKLDAPAPQGSNDRIPKKGQRVSWKAMPGWVHGKVLEIVTDDRDMEGKHIKASKEAPRIALEAESGKFCVHKPDNCYFEDE